ncbi:hypothetical protein [Prochlorococcus marinus]|uniref:hypothetical protein n=1 Tax=Prochlorococcus TaxID=1218 RepID=UPI000A70D2C5|nr:hypothetical protein [Prochlorococcus marinus]
MFGILVAGEEHHHHCDGVMPADFIGSCCNRLSVVDALAIDLLDNPWLVMLSV